MIDLAGRRVLVTGGSRGIGAACVRAFAAAGAAVAVHYRERRESAEAVVEALPEAAAGPHLTLGSDLADAGGAERVRDRLREAWGGLDVLVNNAGIWVRNPLRDLDLAALDRTWNLNGRACFAVLCALLPLLERSTSAAIVNVSSTAGQRGEARYSPYAASKGALIAATKSWAVELAPTIRVNAVAPGWVDTEMCREPFADDGRARIEADIPLGRVAAPEDVAGPVLFLASALARHVTGEVLNVNGGSVLCG